MTVFEQRAARARSIDARVTGAGSIYLLNPVTNAAREWIAEHVTITDETQFWGTALVVEHRYIADLVAGMRRDGLEVR